MASELFIGIDGGGTKCRARICSASGEVRGEGIGGPANARLDPALVMSSILTASLGAVREAGLAEADLRRAHAGFGVAGAGLRSAAAALLRESQPFASVVIERDAYTTWLGAHGGADGAILILGTGSCGLAVVGGRETWVSGWGAEVSDEASGAWIGREAIRRSLWAHDGRSPACGLSDAVMARFGRDPEQVIAFATTAKPGDYAALTTIVVEQADNRDPLSLQLLAEAGADAGRIALRLLAAGAERISLIGGLAGVLQPWLPPPIARHVAPPLGDALDGAILMAKRARITEGWRAHG